MIGKNVLWIDGVGGFAMCESEATAIGGSSSSQVASLKIVSGLPSRAAIFHRRGQDHFVEPIARVFINGIEIRGSSLLSDGDTIRLGESVELAFSQPTQLSGTARLALLSRHRWEGSIDGALMLGQSCLIGPSTYAHVRCRQWKEDVVFFRQRDQWMVRRREFREEGKESKVVTEAVRVGERIQGTDFSMTWL